MERSNNFPFEGSRDYDTEVSFEPIAGGEITRDRGVQRGRRDLDAHRVEDVVEHLVQLAGDKLASALHSLGE